MKNFDITGRAVNLKLGLNLGCGQRLVTDHDGIHFINIDIIIPTDYRYAVEKNAEIMVYDIRTGLHQTEDNSISFINMSQVFEHFNLAAGNNLLIECYRVLKSRAKIRISVPDAKLLIEKYLNSQMDEFVDVQPPIYKKVKSQMLKFGLILFGTMFEHGNRGHKQAYDFEALKELLEKVGFINITRSDFNDKYDSPTARNHQLAVEATRP